MPARLHPQERKVRRPAIIDWWKRRREEEERKKKKTPLGRVIGIRG